MSDSMKTRVRVTGIIKLIMKAADNPFLEKRNMFIRHLALDSPFAPLYTEG
jgi:hypothetical protein